MERQKIAIVGSGISGLSAAWLLAKNHHVTLYEADDRLGGHANTMSVKTADGPVAVDTGFIVYNEPNYPNLTALFTHLDVPTIATDMSFALSMQTAGRRGSYEYSSSGTFGFFGQATNVFRPRHWQLLMDILRFIKTADPAARNLDPAVSLGEFLHDADYSKGFLEHHIAPMGAAIWSTAMADMLAFPARTFIDFYANHGLLSFPAIPFWRTVKGGSQAYIDRLIKDSDIEIATSTGVKEIIRHPTYVHIKDSRGAIRPFDQIVIATHADDALGMLSDPDKAETHLLSAFSYQHNHACLHRDPRFMPKRKHLWSSWNYLKRRHGIDSQLCVTYWMNELQSLPTKTDLFVTLNPVAEMHPKSVEAEFAYQHPVFDTKALRAQKQLWSLQGVNRTWFCGAHFGHGFHEDGLQSGLAVAEQLGGVTRP